MNSHASSTTLSSSAADTALDETNDDQFNVVLRIRPLNGLELNRKDTFTVDLPGEGHVAIETNGSTRNFTFNAVFEPDASQEELFENCGITRLVDMALSGYACTALAFGQTGSGKTHTMTGPPSQPSTPVFNGEFQEGKSPDLDMIGLIQRSFKYLFQQMKDVGENKVVRASYLEIYNEQVIDLLNPAHKRYLAVRWSKNKGFYVENLFTIECNSMDDLSAVLEEGMRNRQTGSHGLNEFSSRSHSMLTVTIDTEAQDQEDENLYITKRGKLTFVDLAGSEKVRDTGSTGGTLTEANSINKSLLILGNCISHLGDAKRRQGHIPYRDSKLTKLLADSLGGNGVTLMIACITPSSHNAAETLNTLRYASRAKKIKTKPIVKMDPREKLILSLKREIKILRNENHYLRQQMDFPAKPKGQLQKENDEKFMSFMKEQQRKESGLYEMLQEYMVENEALRSENSDHHSVRDRIRREQQGLYKENEKLMKRVEELERIVATSPQTWQHLSRNVSQVEPPDAERMSPKHHHIPSGQQYPIQTGHPGHGNPGQGYPVQGQVHPGQGYPSQSGVHSGGQGPRGLPTRLPPQDLPRPDPNQIGHVPNNRTRPPPPPGGAPHRPPHRLSDTIVRTSQGQFDTAQNGGYQDQPQNSPRNRQRQVSPNRGNLDRKVSTGSNSEAIYGMNAKLKSELLELEGEIAQHQRYTQRRHDPQYQNPHR
ncbi:kinesin-like protein KIF12 [Patella vulgata]|uniref:kinesin-like protein KIF12 n=1 Tax=Patella vulgata TaxID=6465 RepID=UPI0024A87C66|nr:kinesin-like protein KIF12 [Patella vulgata]